ncbi:acyltransferase domain-containing protein [Polyangium jinanense]|uniref:Polyketide synthase dehydratase domain-containing protein n=1 Tax=Polyangium jinanense TaxID=2829994 RepID=A0A9X3XE62_9BACT|nr:acyltransferase domain-containing protein [Polyangium jinanense]MDC3957712.1 polyketide synthase dehydratase domain-containing protein [Polyangium jinanense]MDC3987775.1 polyketide synthase dehydratase domain-containing protein [Polyangium jinanense]
MGVLFAIVGIELRVPEASSPEALWGAFEGNRAAGTLSAGEEDDGESRRAWLVDRPAGRLGLFVAGAQQIADDALLTQMDVSPTFLERLPAGHVVEALALLRAMDALHTGRCDLAAVVSIAEGRSAARAGLLLGRYEEMLAQGKPVYALLRGGSSLPGSAPRDCVELLERVCAAEGIEPQSVGLVDLLVEDAPLGPILAALGDALRRSDETAPGCTLGPLSPARADLPALGGVAVVALALHQHLFPPLRRKELDALAAPFVAAPSVRPWIAGNAPRRAGFFALGEEGAGFLLLEQVPRRYDEVPPRLSVPWPAELLLISADDRASLLARLRAVRSALELMPDAPLGEIVAWNGTGGQGRHRVAFVARDRATFEAQLGRLLARLESSRASSFNAPDGIFYADSASPDRRLGMMFPGQGAPYPGMLSDLLCHLPRMRVWIEGLEDLYARAGLYRPSNFFSAPTLGVTEARRKALEESLVDLERGAMYCLVASLSLHEMLTAAGVRADMMLGYSNGENASLVASKTLRAPGPGGVISFVEYIQRTLQTLFAAGNVPGTSIAVNRASPALVQSVLDASGGELHLALDNCPEQVVLFGSASAIAAASTRLRQEGAVCVELPFMPGYHTPLYGKHADLARAGFEGNEHHFGPSELPLYSCSTAAPFPAESRAICDLTASQWRKPVRFRETIERLYAEGVRDFVEVGPGSMLTGFVRNTLRGKEHLAAASNLPAQPGLEQLLKLLGQLYVKGQDIDVSSLRPRAPAPAPRAPEPTRTAPRREPRVQKQPPPAPSPLPASPPAPAAPAYVPEASLHMASQLMQAHGALARDFLDHQQRTLEIFLAAMRAGAGPLAHAAAMPEVQPAEPAPVVEAPGAFPLLGTMILRDERSLVSRRTLSIETDPFLVHHAFGGRLGKHGAEPVGLPVVPLVFSMEIVAEAARALLGHDATGLVLTEVRGSRWLALDRGQLEVEIRAERDEAGVRVRIFDRTIGTIQGGMLAFEGRAQKGSAEPLTPALPSPRERPRVDIDAFNKWLFLGPLMVTTRRALGIDAEHVEVELEAPSGEGLFRDVREPSLELPAVLLDAIGHITAYFLLHHRERSTFGIFPFGEDRCAFTGRMPEPGSRVRLRARIRVAGNITTTDAELIDESGEVFVRVDGLRHRLFPFPDQYFVCCVSRRDRRTNLSDIEPSSTAAAPCRRIEAMDEDLREAGQGIWVRALSHYALTEAEREAFYALPPSLEARLGWVLCRVVAKETLLDWAEPRVGPLELSAIETHETATGFSFSGAALRGLPEVPAVQIQGDGRAFVAALAAPAPTHESHVSTSSLASRSA